MFLGVRIQKMPSLKPNHTRREIRRYGHINYPIASLALLTSIHIQWICLTFIREKSRADPYFTITFMG